MNILQYKQNFIHFLETQDGGHIQQTITIQLKRP